MRTINNERRSIIRTINNERRSIMRFKFINIRLRAKIISLIFLIKRKREESNRLRN